MKELKFCALLTIVCLVFIQTVSATEPVKKAEAHVKASSSQNVRNDIAGTWGKFSSKVDVWTKGYKKAIANAETKGIIKGKIFDEAYKTKSNSSVKVINYGSTRQNRGPAKITIQGEAELSAWANKDIDEVGYAWSGNSSSYKQEPVTVKNCGSMATKSVTEVYGKNLIEYTIKDPGNKTLQIFNKTGVNYDGPKTYAPTETFSSLNFGGAVYENGAKASGEGSGTYHNVPKIIGQGTYTVYQNTTATGGTITGAKATTKVTE